MKNRWLSIFLVIILLFSACTTRPKYGDRSSWSAEMHFKVAQDAANRQAYKVALEEYEEILTKFASYPDKVAMANYEKSVILFRMKKYDDSYRILGGLKADLEDSNKAASIPDWLHVMVPVMYEQVEKKVFEAEEKKRKAAEKQKAKEELKAQKERVKELEKERKEKAQAKKGENPSPDKDETPSTDDESSKEDSSKPEEKEEDSVNDWQPIEPFVPFE